MTRTDNGGTAANGGIGGPDGDWKRASRRGAVISVAAQAVRLALVFITQIFLARLLTPEDFGLVAMVGPILTLGLLLADFGLTQATVQRPNLDQSQLSFIFWLNLAASSALALLMLVAAPLAGWFYGDPRVTQIAAVLASVLVLSGLYAQHMALLNRQMKFGTLAAIDLLSYAGSACVGLALAWYGFDYWALISIGIAQGVFMILSSWIATRWIPGTPRRSEGALDIVKFGGNMSGFNFANFFSRNLDNVIIGKFAGTVQLGYYDRAYRLLLLPIQQVNTPLAKVALPMLARLLDDPVGYRRSYLRMLEAVMFLTYPFIIFAGVYSDDIIVALLGERWAAVAPIFSVLAVTALFYAVGNSAGWLLVTQDRTREMRNYGFATAALFVAAFFAGVPWGALGVAVSYAFAVAVQAPVLMWAATRRGPVSSRDLFRAVKPFGWSAIGTAGAAYLLSGALGADALGLLVGLVATHVLFVALLLINPAGREAVRAAWGQVRQLSGR